MIAKRDVMDEMLQKLAAEVAGSLKESITAVVERELAKSLSRSLVESEFYKRLNEDMFSGLKSIYQELSTARKSDDTSEAAHVHTEKVQAEKLFSEASEQLDNILSTTEQATFKIMDIVERHLEMQAETQAILSRLKGQDTEAMDMDMLREANERLGNDLIEIMTTLSFQDITGQRVKRIIGAIKKVEGIVLDLYLSTGLQLKAKEEEPERDLEEIASQTKQKMTELKGPVAGGVSQGSVDDLLASLGL